MSGDEGVAALPSPLPPLPFEDPNVGFWRGLFATIRLFTLQPVDAYARMRREGPFGRPLLYAILIGNPAFLFVAFCQLLWMGFMMETMQRAAGAPPPVFPPVLFVLYPAMSQLIVPVGLWINALFLHAGARMAGGANERYGATLRAVCYSYTFAIALFVPILGWTVAFLWAYVLEFIGVKSVHRLSDRRAIAAVVLSIVVPTAVFFGLFLLMFAVVGSFVRSG